ncbi:MAG: GNAT family N-acetyltransferase [Candidatus Lokiarchaeota archaeon]|nr:GNAT family N-acetyltransferase [Candidatus Lokiarchaeota archaeon]
MTESRISLKRRRIRSLFLAFEKKSNINGDLENELITSGLEYIQMKLPVVEITPEFERKITEKVEHNILRAKIREAKLEDLESVVTLYNRSWMTSNTPYSPISVESLKIIFEYPETKILVGKVYGSDAAFVILDYEGPNKEYGIIAGLGVIPRFQRKGLGTVIGMAAWNHLKKKGVKELRCEVFKYNKVSYNFIKSIGFVEFARKTYKSEDFYTTS